MIGDTPYDAEAGFKASSAGRASVRRLTEDALRGPGCFAIARETSRLLGALEDTKPSGGSS